MTQMHEIDCSWRTHITQVQESVFDCLNAVDGEIDSVSSTGDFVSLLVLRDDLFSLIEESEELFSLLGDADGYGQNITDFECRGETIIDEVVTILGDRILRPGERSAIEELLSRLL